MKKKLRTIWFKLYIQWLALGWVFQQNLGDAVWHKGKRRVITNGVHNGCWSLDNPEEDLVPKGECRKVRSVANLMRSYFSGVHFYTAYWLGIWVNKGILPWMRACDIWSWTKR